MGIEAHQHNLIVAGSENVNVSGFVGVLDTNPEEELPQRKDNTGGHKVALLRF